MDPEFERPFVFVSYSGRDEREKLIIRRFLARLQDQDLLVWIYESIDGEIPVGFDIEEYCREQLGKAGLVVSFLTNQSLKSEWTQMEVAYAMEKGKPIVGVRIVPISRPSSEWPEVYQKLKARRLLSITSAESERKTTEEEIERAIEAVCRRLGVIFRDDVVHQRAPLAQRICSELWAVPIRSNLEVSVYRELRIGAFRCVKAYRAGEKKQAVKYARNLSFIIEEQILGNLEFSERARVRNYYPRILEAFVLMESSSPAEFLAAKELVIELQEDFFSSQSQQTVGFVDECTAEIPDENLYTLVASVHQRCGEISLAYEWYQKAMSVFEKRALKGDYDPDVDLNCDLAASLIQCEILLGSEFDPGLVNRFASNVCSSSLSELEMAQLRQRWTLEVIRYLASPNEDLIDAAQYCLQAGPSGWGALFFALISRMSQCHEQQTREIGIGLIYSRLAWIRKQDRVDLDYAYYLAGIARAADLVSDSRLAELIFDELVRISSDAASEVEGSFLHPLVEAGMFYYSWMKKGKLQKVCRAIIEISEIEAMDLSRANRHYYRGFGYYLSGSRVKANRCFRHSKRPQSDHYSRALGPDARLLPRLRNRWRGFRSASH